MNKLDQQQREAVRELVALCYSKGIKCALELDEAIPELSKQIKTLKEKLGLNDE
jgi:hypothetical protein